MLRRTMLEVLDILKGSRTGQAILAEHEAGARAERESLIGERELGLKQREHMPQDRLAEHERALTALEKARQALRSAKEKARRAEYAVLAERYGLQDRLERVERRLSATAPAQLDAWIERLREEHANLVATSPVVSFHLQEKSQGGGMSFGDRGVFTSTASQHRRLSAIAEAIREAEAAKLHVLDGAEADAFIEQAKAKTREVVLELERVA